MKKAYTFCIILIIVCVIATVVITLIKGDVIAAVVFPLVIGSVALWAFLAAQNPELFCKYGWKWEYGKFQWGEVDYTTVAKERRKLVAAIITLFFALAILLFWIISIIRTT